MYDALSCVLLSRPQMKIISPCLNRPTKAPTQAHEFKALLQRHTVPGEGRVQVKQGTGWAELGGSGSLLVRR